MLHFFMLQYLLYYLLSHYLKLQLVCKCYTISFIILILHYLILHYINALLVTVEFLDDALLNFPLFNVLPFDLALSNVTLFTVAPFTAALFWYYTILVFHCCTISMLQNLMLM